MTPMIKRGWVVYGFLLATWLVILGWQTAEHVRVGKSARAAIINRAKDISNTLGLVMRSQRRFGMISKERLEPALKELIKPGELNALALLNAEGNVVVAAGDLLHLSASVGERVGVHWTSQTVTLMNLVDLGTNVTQDLEGTHPPIVMPRQEWRDKFETNRPPSFNAGSPPLLTETNADGSTTVRRPPSPRLRPPRGTNDNRGSFGRPFWMSEADYKILIQKQGIHSFLMVLSTQSMEAAIHEDFWMRIFIGVLATISALGSGFAWRILQRSAELQIRLVRASELNSHLKEMNLAAAGLAHETRNPLNIIRGLAQLITKQQEAAPEIKKNSRDIINETDRVTEQLNAFINYSRPREVRRTEVSINAVLSDLTNALTYDIEEKNLSLQIEAEPTLIQADEQLLRQALFNLLLNAIQAVECQGKILVRVTRLPDEEAVLEVMDDGPGVQPEHRQEIFKPYFTTHQKGTGLGLAVVQQIVLAHGWEIHYHSNPPSGAIFRLTHLKVASQH